MIVYLLPMFQQFLHCTCLYNTGIHPVACSNATLVHKTQMAHCFSQSSLSAESGEIPVCVTDVPVSLLPNQLLCSCLSRQIGSIACTKSFARDPTGNHLTPWKLPSQPAKRRALNPVSVMSTKSSTTPSGLHTCANQPACELRVSKLQTQYHENLWNWHYKTPLLLMFQWCNPYTLNLHTSCLRSSVISWFFAKKSCSCLIQTLNVHGLLLASV